MATGCGLRMSGLCKAFPSNGNGPVHALKDFNLQINPGEFSVIVGPNGSGKTTLLNCLAGDLLPDRGIIELNGPAGSSDWSRMLRWERARFLARVHQDPRRGTAAGMTVWENIRLAVARNIVPSPLRFAPVNQKRDWFVERLRRLGLAEKLESRVADLSQGQRQLLALELAMLRKPAFLLLDEHTASLDQQNAKKCLETTVSLSRDSLTTVIMVTHNLMDALTYGDHLVVLRDGRVHQSIKGEEKRRMEITELLDLCGYVM